MEKLRIGVSPCLGPTPDVGHRVCHERIRTAARVRRTGATTGAGAWGLVFAWCIAAVMAATAGDAPFTVTVRNLPTDQGVGRFALYDKPAAYEAKTPLLTGETAITNGVCVWRVPALPAGNYAVSFYQDGNANGVLDRNAIGMPRELLAFSNNTRPRLGPPRYARMQVVHGSTPHEERLEAFSALGRRGRFGLGFATIVNQSPYDEHGARVIAIPMVSYIGERIIVTGPRVSWLFTSTPHTRTALVLQYSFDGFDKDESDRLAGMHERGDTVMAGLSSAWLPTERVTVSGELAADILDEHGGWRGKVGVDREFSIYDVTLAPGLSVEGIDAKAANHYYGVRPAEATATRPAYRLDDVWNIGLDVGARYSLTEKVALFGALQYTLLDAAIRRSPIVAHDALFSVFLSVAYAL